MAVYVQGPAPRWTPGLLLIISTSFLTASAQMTSDPLNPCDWDQCADGAKLESSELYLLQRNARVIRRPTAEVSSPRDHNSLTRDGGSSLATGHAKVQQHKHRYSTLGRCQHSRISAMVTAARAQAVPLTHEQRRAMLSSVQASGLSETKIQFVIGACVLVVTLACLLFIGVAVMECRFGRVFGEVIERGFCTVADEILNLDVTSGSVSVNVLQGRVRISDLQISYPLNCQSNSFLNANIVEAHLNLWNYAWKLLLRKAFEVELDSVVMKDVSLNMGEPKDMNQFFEDIGQRQKLRKSERKLILRKMEVLDVAARMNLGRRVALPNVHCGDFDKATQGEARSLQAVVVRVLQAFCQTGPWEDAVSLDVRKKNGSIESAHEPEKAAADEGNEVEKSMNLNTPD